MLCRFQLEQGGWITGSLRLHMGCVSGKRGGGVVGIWETCFLCCREWWENQILDEYLDQGVDTLFNISESFCAGSR